VESEQLLTQGEIFKDEILRERKALTAQPTKCRSHTMMARILSDVAKRTHDQLIDFAGVRCFDERQPLKTPLRGYYGSDEQVWTPEQK
jgi:hypothetical protein